VRRVLSPSQVGQRRRFFLDCNVPRAYRLLLALTLMDAVVGPCRSQRLPSSLTSGRNFSSSSTWYGWRRAKFLPICLRICRPNVSGLFSVSTSYGLASICFMEANVCFATPRSILSFLPSASEHSETRKHHRQAAKVPFLFLRGSILVSFPHQRGARTPFVAAIQSLSLLQLRYFLGQPSFRVSQFLFDKEIPHSTNCCRKSKHIRSRSRNLIWQSFRRPKLTAQKTTRAKQHPRTSTDGVPSPQLPAAAEQQPPATPISKGQEK